MDFSTLKVLYWTGSIENLSSETPIEAAINESMTYPLVESQTDYVLSLERLSVNLNGIPFYDNSRGEQIEVYSRAGNVLTQVLTLTRDTFTLNDTVNMVNDLILATNIGIIQNGTADMFLNQEGFVYLNFTDFANYYVVFPSFLNLIFGISTTQDAGVAQVKSLSPRFDCGDELQRIRITSNLGVFSDTIGQSKANIITDLELSRDLTADSLGNFSFSQRQKLYFTPTQKRYLNFSSPAPLQNLNIRAEYIRTDGSSTVIPLPLGCAFSLKLGFYKRV